MLIDTTNKKHKDAEILEQNPKRLELYEIVF